MGITDKKILLRINKQKKRGVETMRQIGIDLHKRMFVVCCLNGKQKKFCQYQMSKLSEFVKQLKKDDEIAVEATGNTKYFVRQIEGKVKRVVIVNPQQFKVISQSVKKTDSTDAETLAIFLQKGMLPEVRMKDEAHSQLTSMANTRDRLVKLRTVLKNKIHNILLAHGIETKREAFSSEKELEKVLTLNVNAVAKVELTVIVQQIKHLNEGIKKLEQEFIERGKNLDGFESITSIKGIGKKSGTILLSIIGNIKDFKDEKKLAAYFGIVPRVHNSADTIHQGRITKQGNALGRTTLVQCTLIAIRYSHYLRTFYDRIKQKKGSGKAIIATARKLLSIIYQTLTNGWVFEDFSNFVIRKT